MDTEHAFFGEARIIETMADRGLDASAVVFNLHAALRRHCGGPSRTDDVTILCVDRTT